MKHSSSPSELQFTNPDIFFTASSQALVLYGRPTANVPIFHTARFRIIELPTLWIFSLAINARTTSLNTWKAYASALLDYLRSCEASDWNYLTVTDDHLAAYRTHLAASISIRGTPVKARTVNHRLSAIIEFYRWLKKQGLELRLSAGSRQSYSLGGGWFGARKERNELYLPNGEPRKPIAIRVSKIQAICQHLKERDNLLASWALATGAREHELLALNLNQIPDTQSSQYAHNKLIAIPIFITKGNRARDLLVPRRVIDLTWRYILGERALIAKRISKTRALSSDARNAVFLSFHGKRHSSRSIQQDFRAAADSEGSRAVFHDLRHTFAIHRLAQLRNRPIANDYGQLVDPLLTLRDILGHKHVNTTMIYLGALENDPRAAEDAMLSWYTDWAAK